MRPGGYRPGAVACDIADLTPRGGAGRGTAEDAAMVEDVPVRVCLDALRNSGEPGAARALAQEHRTALLGTAGVASGLVAVAVDGPDGDRRLGLDLFEALLEQARMDEESRGRLGTRFLEEASAAIGGLVLLDGIAPAATHGLTMAYARAEAEVPAPLVERLIGQIGPLRESGRLPFDTDTEIDALRPVLESEPWTLHRMLDERIGVFPDAARAAFACEVACRDEEACGRIALYWLLDRSEEVRTGAADGFVERALQGIVEPVSAALVPLVRNWIPADPARAVLDQALREARKRSLFAPLPHPAWRPVRFVASLPDRAGNQAFIAMLEGGPEPAAASVVTDGRRGIGESFIVSGAGALAAMPGQDGDAELFDVSREVFEAGLSAAIAAGLAAGRPPPAGLIDVALACGMVELRPRPMTALDWLRCVDPDGETARLTAAERDALVEASADWPMRYLDVEYWSEGTAMMQDVLEEYVSGNELEAVFWSKMEQRRDGWALLMLRAAHVLKGAGDEGWRSFAATACALLDGCELRTVPIMGHIVGETAAVWMDEEYGRLSEGDDGTAELVRLIAAAAWPEGGILSEESSAWADGYLSAAILSPLGARPDVLFAAAAQRAGSGAGGRAGERLASALTARYRELETGYREARFVAEMFAGLDERELRAWAQGLAMGVGILDTEWPTEAFISEERRSLSQIAAFAAGERVDLDTRAEVVKFIRARLTMRDGDGQC